MDELNSRGGNRLLWLVWREWFVFEVRVPHGRLRRHSLKRIHQQHLLKLKQNSHKRPSKEPHTIPLYLSVPLPSPVDQQLNAILNCIFKDKLLLFLGSCNKWSTKLNAFCILESNFCSDNQLTKRNALLSALICRSSMYFISVRLE